MNRNRSSALSEHWQPPAELLRSPPRLVRLSAAGKALAGVAVALLAGALVSGVWLYVLAARDAARFDRILREGVSTQAEVIRVGRTRRDDEVRRVVTYAYGAGAQSYRGRTTLRRRDRRSLETGSRIPVRYLPADPGRSWMHGYEPKGVPLWAFLVVSLGLALGAAPIALVLRSQRRLLEEGRPALARVTQCRRTQSSGHSRTRVQYEFRILSGAIRTGSYEVEKNPPAAGSTLTVIYHREEPRRNARYPLPLVRTARPGPG